MSRKRDERTRTDQSLYTERERTDDEFDRLRAGSEARSDRALARSREQTDRAVRRARDDADADLDGNPSEVVQAERRLEDEERRRERDTADLQRLADSAEGKRAMVELLRLEREATDLHLDLERADADRAIASRDDFLGMVSHDLRGLLTAMALSAGAMARLPPEAGGTELVRQQAERQRHLVARMHRIVGDLLDVVSIEAGRLSVSARPSDAGALVREVVAAFEPLAATHDVALTSDVGGGLDEVELDPDRLLQVLTNLLSNALHFTPAQGSVSVTVARRGDEVRFAVSDTGPGVPAEQAQAVFDRFWQASERRAGGLGIGLHISRSIVEAHGGRIWVEPRPGGGSTFAFTLPTRPPPQ